MGIDPPPHTSPIAPANPTRPSLPQSELTTNTKETARFVRHQCFPCLVGGTEHMFDSVLAYLGWIHTQKEAGSCSSNSRSGTSLEKKGD